MGLLKSSCQIVWQSLLVFFSKWCIFRAMAKLLKVEPQFLFKLQQNEAFQMWVTKQHSVDDLGISSNPSILIWPNTCDTRNYIHIYRLETSMPNAYFNTDKWRTRCHNVSCTCPVQLLPNVPMLGRMESTANQGSEINDPCYPTSQPAPTTTPTTNNARKP